MAEATDTLWLPVLPSMRGFGPALASGADKEAEKTGKSAGKKFGLAMAAGVAAVGAGALAAGAALYKVGEVFDEVTDTIRVGTGATGAALDGLVASAKNVGKNVPADFEKVGTTVADINTRLGLSGTTLETVASQYLEAGRILGEDVDVNKTSAAFSAFKIEGDAVVGAMDHLFQVSQATGVGMNELADGAARNAPAMEILGFSFEQTTAMIGSFDKAGLNSSALMASMSKGMVTLAKDGEEPAAAFKRVQEEITKFVAAGDDAAALELASKVFGTKGAAQFIGAVKSGALNLDDMSRAAGQTGDTILGVGAETMDFAEQWMIFKNRVLVWLEPLATKVFGAMGTAMGEVNGAVTAFGAAWAANDGDITSSGLPGLFERLAFAARDLMEIGKGIWAGFKMPPEMAAGFGDKLNPLLAIGANIREIFDRIAPVFVPLVERVISLAMALSPLGLVLKAIKPVLPQIVELFASLAEALGGALAQILPTITDLVGSLVGTLSGVLIQVMPVVVSLVGALAGTFAMLLPVVARVIGAIAPLIAQLVGSLIPIIVQLVSSVLPPVIGLFMAIVGAIAPLVEIILAVLIPVIQLLMPIVQVAFAIIAAVITVAIAVVTGILTGLVNFIGKVLAPIFMWLWTGIIQPVFKGIGDFIGWAWNYLIRPIFTAMKWYIDNILAPVFTWLWQTIIKPAFDGISSAIKWAWENGIKPVFDFLSKAIRDDVPAAFQKGVDAAKLIWDTLLDIAKKPVRFVVNTVINDGLIGAFNKVAGILPGIDQLPRVALPAGFARGGVLAGKSSWRDGDDQLVPMRRGEGVYVSEAMRDPYERARLFAMNKAAMMGHSLREVRAKFGEGFARGGIVNPVKNMSLTQGFSAFHDGIDIGVGVGTPVFAADSGRITHAGPGATAPGVSGGNEVHLLANGIETWYAHLSQIGVKLGQMVTAGQQIALSGNTGISSGPHLHFGAYNGRWPNAINPLSYLSGAAAPQGGDTGGGWMNPLAAIQGLADGVVDKMRGAFPAAGFMVDAAAGMGKKIFSSVIDWAKGKLGMGGVAGAGQGAHLNPLLYDQGGVLRPGISTIMNATGKPEAIYTQEQNRALQELAARGADGGMSAAALDRLTEAVLSQRPIVIPNMSTDQARALALAKHLRGQG